ncbi:SGNH/GDSL hydrolase family protein [uncultured Sphingomonas sp.]|uniref:SGNH/GDSL hydrolase family protein n=1 Tax=uncultured Sphingomonas sp. TaxID=158754 RepID=UPI0025EACDDC|nr:SGNH/GDSL hydrolase family protein [uncultured Sphingomonas sp.]
MSAAEDLAARAIAVLADERAAVAGRFAQLRALRWHAPAPLASPAPKLTQTVTNISTIATGDSIGKDDARLTYSGTVPVADGGGAPYNTSNVGAWVTTPAGPNTASGNWSLRFQTDAPVVELIVGDWHGASSYAIRVDGEPVARSTNAYFPNVGGTRYLRIDFGSDVQGIVANQVLVSGGSGYAVGDELTVQGGTTGGAAMVLVVSGVNAGAVTHWYVKQYGAYTAVPGAGATTTTNGAGTGATFNVTNNSPAFSNHTTRRMRRIEAYNTNGKIIGVRVPTLSVVRPWPVAGPRLFAMTDSYGDTFQLYAGGGWPFRVAERLGIEDVWVNGRGGTGFLATNNGTQSKYRDRLGDIVAQSPAAALTPVVLLTQGSINDNAAADADLTAEVTAYYNQAFTALPNAVLVQTGMLRPAGNAPSDAKSAAVLAGFLAAQAIHDPGGRRSAYIETRGVGPLMTPGGRAGAVTGTGNSDYWVSGDNVHPTQDGMDFLGDAFALSLRAIFARLDA